MYVNDYDSGGNISVEMVTIKSNVLLPAVRCVMVSAMTRGAGSREAALDQSCADEPPIRRS